LVPPRRTSFTVLLTLLVANSACAPTTPTHQPAAESIDEPRTVAFDVKQITIGRPPTVIVEVRNATDDVIELSRWGVGAQMNGLDVDLDGAWVRAFDYNRSILITPPFGEADSIRLDPHETRLEHIELGGRWPGDALRRSDVPTAPARIEHVYLQWSPKDQRSETLKTSWQGIVSIERPRQRF
jgi:hypothetical protein